MQQCDFGCVPEALHTIENGPQTLWACAECGDIWWVYNDDEVTQDAEGLAA